MDTTTTTTIKGRITEGVITRMARCWSDYMVFLQSRPTAEELTKRREEFEARFERYAHTSTYKHYRDKFVTAYIAVLAICDPVLCNSEERPISKSELETASYKQLFDEGVRFRFFYPDGKLFF